jgi:hypothetical protein
MARTWTCFELNLRVQSLNLLLVSLDRQAALALGPVLPEVPHMQLGQNLFPFSPMRQLGHRIVDGEVQCCFGHVTRTVLDHFPDYS